MRKMNAQEALNELKKTYIYEIKSHLGNHKFHIQQDEEAVNVLQQLIDQANATPKTLEELGWKLVRNDEYLETYTKESAVLFDFIDIYKKSKSFAIYSKNIKDICPYYNLSYEELIAIAEKMKELGAAT